MLKRAVINLQSAVNAFRMICCCHFTPGSKTCGTGILVSALYDRYLNLASIEFPIMLSQIKQFETLNISINVYINSRYTRRVLTNGAREECGAWRVLIGVGGTHCRGGKAWERRREGPDQPHRCLCKHRTPVDGLHKHDDVSLCLSYFSPLLSQTFHVTFFFITRRCRRHRPRVHSKMRFWAAAVANPAFTPKCISGRRHRPRVHPKMRRRIITRTRCSRWHIIDVFSQFFFSRSEAVDNDIFFSKKRSSSLLRPQWEIGDTSSLLRPNRDDR